MVPNNSDKINLVKHNLIKPLQLIRLVVMQELINNKTLLLFNKLQQPLKQTLKEKDQLLVVKLEETFNNWYNSRSFQMFQLIRVQHNHNLFKINKVHQNMLEIKLSNHNLVKEIREFCSKAHRLQRDSQNNIDEKY